MSALLLLTGNHHNLERSSNLTNQSSSPVSTSKMLKSKKQGVRNTTAPSLPPLPAYSPDAPPPGYDQALTTGTRLDSTAAQTQEKPTPDTSLADPFDDNWVLSNTLAPNVDFVPETKLILQANGICLVRIPLPSAHLEIHVFREDGTPVYTSVRETQCKGDAVLKDHAGNSLVATDYFFGPGRTPAVRMLPSTYQDPPILKIKSHHRSLDFTHATTGKHFKWSYIHIKAAEGDRARVLTLQVSDTDLPASTKTDRVIAQLVRCNATRTPGTRRSFAGNGGQLVLSQGATEYLSQELIVATCLMMLKREIDRRRFKQFAFLMAGIFWL